VVKGGRAPSAGGVADGAIGGESRRDVIGTCGSVEVRLMASVACGRSRCVVVVGVALRAGEGRMHPCQRVVGVDGMVEGDGSPVCGGVASGACGGEARGYVIGVCRCCKVSLMASIAGRWQSRVIVIGVALSASKASMSSCQGKSRMIE
jgi:hypothetical protein